MEEIKFGSYLMSGVLSVVLAFIFKMAGDKIGDRWKSIIAVCCGVGLGILAIPYNRYDFTISIIVDHIIYGFLMGCSAVGLYEIQRAALRPRS